jgi:hypothetical protein
MSPLKPHDPYKFLRATIRRDPLIVCDLAEPRLRPIKAISWHFVQNPEFAKLEIMANPASRATVANYVDRYGVMGHVFDLKLQLGSEECRLHRPICTQAGSNYLVLEFLLNGLSLELDKD